jgi:cysteine desulfurase/selenocysteine lyase
MLAPFGVGVLYAKEHLLRHSLPFLYGGDMIAEGRVFPGQVDYNDLPWKFSAGTPNILGVIVSAQALRLLADLTTSSERPLFGGTGSFPYAVSKRTMDRVARHTAHLTGRAQRALAAIDGLTVYGPRERAPLIAFNRAGTDPFTLVKALDQRGVEARAGCHCATLAHHALRLDPPASCRLSFALYNTEEDVDRAVAAVGSAS